MPMRCCRTSRALNSALFLSNLQECWIITTHQNLQVAFQNDDIAALSQGTTSRFLRRATKMIWDPRWGLNALIIGKMPCFTCIPIITHILYANPTKDRSDIGTLQGLVNVLFWGFWASPWNICWRLSPIVGWCLIGIFTNPCFIQFYFTLCPCSCPGGDSTTPSSEFSESVQTG